MLGYGTWFRYIAHRILIPLGVRRALYLDGDTCSIRPLQGLFRIARNVTAPLVVSRRAVPQWKLRYWLAEKGTDVKVASTRWGFESWRDDEVHMFNSGVMLMNLQAYCLADIWGRMRSLAHHHATVSRLFGPLDTVKEFGDNQAIEIVGAAHSHMVGTEWNCRHSSALKSLRAVDTGRPCHIRHIHEDEKHKGLGSIQTCANLVAKHERARSTVRRALW